MTDKLVELIAKYFEKLNPNSNHIIATQLAGYLRNNGVTVQQWIPVSERLPGKTGKYLAWNRIVRWEHAFEFTDIIHFNAEVKAWLFDGLCLDTVTPLDADA